MELELKPFHSGHLYDSRVLIIHLDFGLPHQDHPHSWRRVGGRLIKFDSHQSSNSSIEMSDKLASTLASIQEFMAGSGFFYLGTTYGVPFHLSDHYETAPPSAATMSPPIRLESRMRHIILQDGGLTWDDRDGILVASLPTKFCMLDIERYSGIGCPNIHLRLYNTVMRAHGIDDAQLVTLFPMSLSGTAQRWFASVESSRLCTWEDVAHEFLTQFAFSVDIDVSRRELEATRQRPDESISSFVIRWRAKMSCGHSISRSRVWFKTFSVEKAIAQGLWMTSPSPDKKGKRIVRSSSRFGEVDTISYQHERPAHHSYYRSPTTKAHLSHLQHQYQPVYAQQPYIAQTSMQSRLPHPRVTTPLPPRPYAQRPTRHIAYIIDSGHDTERCATLHHAISDLIDSGLVNFSGPSVTTNPLPTHSTHAVPPTPSL
ncbi:hypothetical protein AAG906_016432 [Vitis piasezkii]